MTGRHAAGVRAGRAGRTIAVVALVAGAVIVPGSVPAGADSPPTGEVGSVAPLRVDHEVDVDPLLRRATGTQHVLVRLRGRSAAQGASTSSVRSAQRSFAVDALSVSPSARVVGSVDTLLNGVFMTVDAKELSALAALPAVDRISRVKDYEIALSDTVPYIGASAMHTAGTTGTGVTVAVLDSGIDYTHTAFGGAGTAEAYSDAYLDPVDTTGFPTARVTKGKDFVGESWPNADLAPDDDPIDAEGGHGTHVADIIGGTLGVAPDVELWAIKVCSAVDTACSGQAMVEGFDYAADPNNDGITSDHADIVNMSLGSPYGQAFDDDLSYMVDQATALGMLSVAAAGNDGDQPYVQGAPAAAPTAISVAQTSVPSSVQYQFTLDSVDRPMVWQSWSAVPAGTISVDARYGEADGTPNLDACSAFDTDLSATIVLVDRGNCDFSTKVSNIAAAGADAALIAMVTAEDPFEAGLGEGLAYDQIPGFMISLADGDAIRDAIGAGGATITIDSTNTLSLAGTVVGSSARGPSMGTNLIKPEIGAPGASVSAVAGSGTGTEVFGGTSGASPMVAGAAALLLEENPTFGPREIKALLMNNAQPDILDRLGGELAPISRLGAGEVRVSAAADAAADALAWVGNGASAALSFGFVEAYQSSVTRSRQVTVRNLTGSTVAYDLGATFRDPADEARGAVSLQFLRNGVAVTSVSVPALSTATVTVRVVIDSAQLADWTGNSGPDGASPAWLDALEYDGWVTLSSSGHPTMTLPWHVLPRKAGNVIRGDSLMINAGAGETMVTAFSLLGTSPDQPEGEQGTNSPVPDLRAAGFAVRQVEDGACDAEGATDGEPDTLLLFGINTWERQTHLNAPASPSVLIDTNRDGAGDYEAFTYWEGAGGSVVVVLDAETQESTSWFYAEHDTNTGNTIIPVCPQQIGVTDGQAKSGRQIDVQPLMFESWFMGEYTDGFDDFLTVDLSGGRFGMSRNGRPRVQALLGSGGSFSYLVSTDRSAQSCDAGLMLMFTGGAPTSNEISLAPRDGLSCAPRVRGVTEGVDGARVKWYAPAYDGGQSITGYVIQMSTNGGAWRFAASVGPSARAVTVRGLSSASTYRFRVAAVTSVGRGVWSARSGRVTPLS